MADDQLPITVSASDGLGDKSHQMMPSCARDQ